MDSNQQTPVFTAQIVRDRDPVDKKRIINGYKILKNIGEGAYGKIKLAEKDGRHFAVKKFNKFLLQKKNKIYKNPDGTTKYVSFLSEVRREIQIHTQLNHPNIIKVIAVMDSEESDKLYIVLEEAERGTILNWNSKKLEFSLPDQVPLHEEQFFLKFFEQTLQALKYLHENLVIHRDIKPQNILINADGVVKICDFGTALKLDSPDHRIRGTEGTFQFMAPECLKENSKEKAGYLGQQADVWSLGVVLFCISELQLPFQDDNMLQLFTKIQNDSPKLTRSPFSQKVQDIIMLMLDKDPSTRATVDQLLQMIK